MVDRPTDRTIADVIDLVVAAMCKAAGESLFGEGETISSPSKVHIDLSDLDMVARHLRDYGAKDLDEAAARAWMDR